MKRVGSIDSTERPQDRSDVATFYAGSSPGYVMNLAARQVSVAQGRSLSHNARAFALINMAINDSFVASFGNEVSLQLLAARDGHSRRRDGRQPENRTRRRLEAAHPRAVLPELWVEPRRRKLRRRRGAQAPLRRRRPRDHDVEPGVTGTGVSLHRIQADHRGHRRRARLRRHPFPLRSGERSASRRRGRRRCLQGNLRRAHDGDDHHDRDDHDERQIDAK